MKSTILKIKPFETHATEYDEWYDMYPYVFESEVEALRDMMPAGEFHGIEVGLGTGRFSKALGIKEGVEPADAMRKIAISRGIETINAAAEKLPYKDMHFDLVLMVSCISYFNSISAAFHEANRVLKRNGSLIVGFIKKDSSIAKFYEGKRQKSKFFKQATFYSVSKIISELKQAGFNKPGISQTLFHNLDEIKEFEPAKPGYNEGSFIVIKAIKK